MFVIKSVEFYSFIHFYINVTYWNIIAGAIIYGMKRVKIT